MTTDGFTLRSIEAFCYRYPLATPVVTSFGKCSTRPPSSFALSTKTAPRDGGRSGRTFRYQVEHRTRLVNEVLAPGPRRPQLRASCPGFRDPD